MKSVLDVARIVCTMAGDTTFDTVVATGRLVSSVMDELGLLVLPFYRSEIYTIEDNMTVSLPKDCLLVEKVGVLDCDGRVLWMGRDMNLRVQAKNEAEKCTCDADTQDPCPVCDFRNVFIGGMWRGEMYGRRTAEFINGMFRYDRQRNVIEFGSGYDTDPGTQVLVEYKSELTPGEYQSVPNDHVLMLAFRTSQLLNLNARPASAQAFEREFRRSMNMLKRARFELSPADLAAAMLGQSTLAPRY